MLNLPYLNIFKSLCSLSLSIFLGLALVSYNEADPSFNRATNITPENLAGHVGAYVADPVLQIFGLASIIMVLIPLCWAIVYFRYGKVSLWLFKLLAGLIALSSAAVLLSYIDYSNSYFASPGGASGILLRSFLTAYFPKELVQIGAAISLVISLYFCLSLAGSTWIGIGRYIIRAIDYLLKSLQSIFQKFKFSRKVINEKIKPVAKTRLSPNITASNAEVFEEQVYPVIKTPVLNRAKEEIVYNRPMNNLDGFILPSTDLLQKVSVNKDALQQNKSVIKQHTEELLQVLADFGVMGDVVGAASDPVVTLYELEPAAGTKSSRIIGLSDDISRSMRATSARIAVIPGRNAIGIELPNKQRETVYLKEMLESSEYRDKDYDLPIILGKDISGNVVVADLARMPHLLVAGTTGSGKSVAINTMILSLLYALTPDQCKFIMVDPKMLELSVYDGIPHLLTNVVTEPGKAVVALKWVVKEMETRYRLMSNLGVRNIHNYNERIKAAIANGEVIQRTVQTGFDLETGQPKIEQVPLDMKILPFIVVIVDEMADLMIVAGKDIETSIQRLAQMARAAGIHIIMATQRPSVDVITGVIKANFPTRISFQVTSKIDSRTILGEQGAEQLLGKGDMLYMAGGSKITRIHGPFVADSEVEKIVSYLKSQGQPDYMNDITSDDGSYGNNVGNGAVANSSISDELYQQAIEVVQLEGKASTSFIQRCLKIGYNRAANIMEKMEKEGLVSKPNHVGKREILM